MTEWLTLSLSNVLLAVKLCNQPVSHNHFSTSPATATWWLPGFSTESEHTRLPADPSLAFLMPLGIQADDQHGPEEPENGSRSKKFTAHSPSRTFTCPSSRTQAHTHDSSEARADWNLLLIHFQNSHLPSRRSINKALNTAREGWSWVSTVPQPMDVKTGKAEWDGTDLFSDLCYSLATVTETLWAVVSSSMKRISEWQNWIEPHAHMHTHTHTNGARKTSDFWVRATDSTIQDSCLQYYTVVT